MSDACRSVLDGHIALSERLARQGWFPAIDVPASTSRTIADVASPEEGADKYPQSIGEPLFELPLSGWYWQVTRLDTKAPEIHSSRSLWDSNLPRLPDANSVAASEYRQGYARGPEDQDLRMVERNVDLGTDE